VDETWIHHYTPETKQQSKQWIGAGESVPRKAKTVPSAGKVMAAVFWDSRGVVLIDYLQKAVHTSSRQHNILYLGLDIGPLWIPQTNAVAAAVAIRCYNTLVVFLFRQERSGDNFSGNLQRSQSRWRSNASCYI
jgi:hypothetical protein